MLAVNRKNDVAIMQGGVEENSYGPIRKIGLAKNFGKFFIMGSFI